MGDYTLPLFGVFGLVGLAYCIWKSQSDWQQRGFGLVVVWGWLASVSAFLFVASLFVASVFKHF